MAFRFERCIGIDYSGAADADTPLSGIRVVSAIPGGALCDVGAQDGRHWTRRGLAHWLDARLSENELLLIGIDHGLGFPEIWRETHGLPSDWDSVLETVCARWPTDLPGARVRDLRKSVPDGVVSSLEGDPRWRRLAERRVGAKSVFHFDVPGSVANSTFAGLPWVRWLRKRHREQLHCWPFDGWIPLRGKSVLVEAWPALWNTTIPDPGQSRDLHDARVLARSMADAVADGRIESWWEPSLPDEDRETALREGWILGVG